MRGILFFKLLAHDLANYEVLSISKSTEGISVSGIHKDLIKLIINNISRYRMPLTADFIDTNDILL